MLNTVMNICLMASMLPPEYVSHVNAQYPSDAPLGPEDEVPDVMLAITFNPGWYDPGRISGPPENCYPPEGEDPEVLSLDIEEPDYKGPTRVNFDGLSRAEQDRIIEACWKVQQAHDDEDYYDEPDDWHDPDDFNGYDY